MRSVTECPFEVVEQRPARVTDDLDPVCDAIEHAIERGGEVANPLVVVVGANAVLGHQDGDRTTGDIPRAPDRGTERLWPVLVAQREHIDAVLRTKNAGRSD